MKSEPGTYALILRSRSRTTIQVGSRRQIDLEPGFYVYVGSAFGPGGVLARVARHVRETKRKHWHIDYLRDHLEPLEAWFSHEAARLEHRWARALARGMGLLPVQGIGCSDCSCQSHLFHTRTAPAFARFRAIVGGRVEVWSDPGA
jgi:Uri superfamily endonuclease